MIIYKYRDWDIDNHKKILTHNEVFLSSPKDLNDPLDCRISPNFSLLDNDEKKMLYSKNFVERHEEFLLSKGKNLIIETNNLFAELKYNLDNYQTKYDENLFEMQDKYFGIFSLSTSWNSNSLWTNYGKNHQGFVIGYDEECLKKSEKFGKGGLVIYHKTFPAIYPIDIDTHDSIQNMFKQQFSKSYHYSFEEEYRIAKNFFPKNVTVNERKVIIEEECISEIGLGSRISAINAKQITNIAKARNIPIFQMKTKPNSFEMEREYL